MSHLDVDVDRLSLAGHLSGAALFLIEMVSRAGKIPTWIKLSAQGVATVGFATAYVTLITAHWLTSLVLVALAIALFYQAKRAKIDPSKTIY